MKALEWVIEVLKHIECMILHSRKWEKLAKIDDYKDGWNEVRDLIPWDVKNIIAKHIEKEVQRQIAEAKQEEEDNCKI